MGFWKWYYRGILKAPRGLISPWGEYAWAVLILFIVSPFLSIVFSPFYVFLTVPVSVTMIAHAYWRGVAWRTAK